jgi:WD40 repeat protein/tetratricopeptide (TPR) repeat protein
MSDTPNDATTLQNRFEEAVAQFLQAREEGRSPDPERYVQSFPEVASRLREFFAGQALFDQLAPGLGTTPQDTIPEAGRAPGLAAGSRLGRFELLEELGRGGMGIVYKARQLEPERVVALKVIRADRLEMLSADERRDWIDRFRREARLIAAVDQPAHIIGLYEFGEFDAGGVRCPYFKMRLVEGGSLSQRLRAVRTAEERRRGQQAGAWLLATVARAVDHAHQRGVLHRDLKPANILLDADGQPLVSDFGLAKEVGGAGPTQTGAIVGTPAYMAPEQARPGQGAVTVASDVYALGAVLYEMLTGQPPFQDKDDLETLLLSLQREPAPPHTFTPGISRDLETICLKCLAKEPQRRYGSAAALADDLDRWLRGEPIAARPVGAAERAWYWCRLKPLQAAVACVLLLAFVGLLALGGVSWWQAVALSESNQKLLKEQGEKTAKANEAAEHARKREEAERKRKEAADDKARQAVRDKAWSSFQQGLSLCEQGDVPGGLHELANTLDLALQSKDTELEREARVNLAAWDRRLHALRVLLPHNDFVTAVGFTPDGQRLRTGTGVSNSALNMRRERGSWDVKETFEKYTRFMQPLCLREWEGETGLLVHKVEPFPDVVLDLDRTRGRFSARGLWIGPEGQLLVSSGEPPRDPLTSPDPVRLPGTRGAARGNAMVMSFTETGPNRINLHTVRVPDLPASILAVALSPDGKKVVTGGDDGVCWMFDTARLRKLGSMTTDPARLGRSLGGRGMGRGPGGRGDLPDLYGRVEVIAFRPDGRLIATGGHRYGRGFVEFWDSESGMATGKPLQTEGAVLALAFSADDKQLLTGSRQGGVLERGGEARLWEVETSRPLGPPLKHTEVVNAVAFSPDGRTFATASGDPSFEAISYDLSVARGEVQLWDAATSKPLGPPLLHRGAAWSVAFSPDGRAFATGSLDRTAQLREFAGPEEAGLLHEESAVEALSPAAGAVIVRVGDGAVQVRDAHTGRALAPPQPCPGVVLALGPDGQTAFVRLEKAGQFWNARTGKAIGPPQPLDHYVAGVAFSPDGRFAVTAGQGKATHVWDATTGKQIASLQDVKNTLGFARFHSDGKTVVTAGGRFWNTAVRLWDAPTGKALRTSMVHTKPIYITDWGLDGRPTRRLSDERLLVWVRTAALSRDGGLVLTGGDARGAQLWEVDAGKERITLPHDGRVLAVAISSDGKTLLTGSEDKTARMWDLAGKPLGPPMPHPGSVDLLAFSPDDVVVLTAAADRGGRLWDRATGRALGPPMIHSDPVRTTTFSADGRTVFTVSSLDPDGPAVPRAWDVAAPALGDPDAVRLWVQVRTGCERAGQGPARPLDLTEWEKRRDRLREREAVLPAGDAPARQRLAALRAERTGQWKAAGWYPGRLLERAPQDPFLLIRRARAYRGAGVLGESLADFSAAIEAGADDAQTWFERADAHARLGRWREAADDLTEAEKRSPDTAVIFHRRARANAARGEWQKALADLEKLTRAPVYAYREHALILLHLGRAGDYRNACSRWAERLSGSIDVREVAALLEVCSLAPDAPPLKALLSRFNLTMVAGESAVAVLRGVGAGLCRAGEHLEAVRLLRRPSLLQRRDTLTALLLGLASHGLGQADQARGVLSQAAAWMDESRYTTPEVAEAIGLARWDALAWEERLSMELLYREAVAKISSLLRDRGEFRQAIPLLKLAVKLQRDNDRFWFTLATAHADLGEDAGAAAAFREVIRLRPNDAEAHCLLGLTLQRQGKIAEGLEALRRGHDLGLKIAGWPYPAGEWVKRAEELVALEKKVSAIREGKEKPASPEEALELAVLCHAQGHYASAARLAADTLKDKLSLGEDLRHDYRYLAACAAAQAGCGRGEEAARLTPEERTRWRDQALGWLRADLAAGSQPLAQGPP